MKQLTENILRPVSERAAKVNAAGRAPNEGGLIWSAIAASLLVAGCASRQVPTPKPAGSAPAARYQAFDEVYRLTERRFESTYLIKPAEGWMTGLLKGDLAPLIVQEVAPRGPRSGTEHAFGALLLEDGAVRVDPSQPTVYVQIGRRKVNGRTYRVVAYCTFHAGERSPKPRVTVTIIRAILDADGFPLVWEIVQSREPGALTPRPQILYVSRSLETAAADRFGPPLPDRRHSTEPRLEDAPRSVVARVIEDGPMPMGPYVYAAAGTGRITTLHCRCSEAQMDAVLESTYYELVSFEDVADLASEVFRRVFRFGSGDPLTLGPGLPFEEALRWPLEP